MQYISYHHGDAGFLQISVWDADNNEWGQWSDIGDPVSYWERVWSQRVVDLTAYAGQTIRIGFLHTADNRYEDHGWFIDNVRMMLPPIEPPGAAQPISPSEQTINRTPTYEWINVAGASRYHLVAEDVNSTHVSQWLSSSEANCSTQSGRCSAAPGGRLELADQVNPSSTLHACRLMAATKI